MPLLYPDHNRSILENTGSYWVSDEKNSLATPYVKNVRRLDPPPPPSPPSLRICAPPLKDNLARQQQRRGDIQQLRSIKLRCAGNSTRRRLSRGGSGVGVTPAHVTLVPRTTAPIPASKLELLRMFFPAELPLFRPKGHGGARDAVRLLASVRGTERGRGSKGQDARHARGPVLCLAQKDHNARRLTARLTSTRRGWQNQAAKTGGGGSQNLDNQIWATDRP